MNTLAERLKSVMNETGVRQLDLARACGISAPSVNNWLSGKTRALKGVTLHKAAALLGVNELWLAEGIGPKGRADTSNTEAHTTIAPTWPFREVSPERYAQLPEFVKGVIEGRILAEVESWEASSRKT